MGSGRAVPPRTTNKVARFFKALYLKLFRINDTPQKIAIGFGVGVFSESVVKIGGNEIERNIFF